LTPTPAASSSRLRTPSLGNFCRGKYSWLYNQIVEAINLEEYLVLVLAKIWGVKMRHPMTVAISVSTCWIPTWCVVLNYLGLSETWVTPHSIVWFRTSFFPKKSSFNLQGHSTWSAPQCPVRVYLVADLESRTQEGLRMVAMVAMVAVCWFHSRGKWDWDFRLWCLGMLYAVNGKNRLRYALVHLVPHNTGNHWEVCF
jgi:hypothetical protein